MSTTVASVRDYLAQAPPAARAILQKIRAIVRDVAPDAEERISYQMPAFFRDGVIIYYAAFQRHIGIFPPVTGDASLEKALRPYRGPKGNLKFPLDKPIPFPLIRRIVRARLKELGAKRRTAKRR
jgi:uncharacterized protein YdhG (YjbR/CyaY superfamily)